MSTDNTEAEYWNGSGGERWVENIERLESMLSVLTDHLLDSCAVNAGETVLDIGCGGGVTSAALAERVGPNGEVIGADVSAVILDVARSRYRDLTNLEFTTADVGTHSFPLGHFNLITSRFGVMFFPDPPSAFANIRKAGKPGGRVVLMCWRPLKDNPWMGAPVAAAFSVIGAPEKGDPNAPGPFSLADADKTKRLLEDAGFANVRLNQVDKTVNLGQLEPALDFLSKMGPAAVPLAEASSADRDKAIVAMREVLTTHKTSNGVVMPASVWIVEGDIV